MHYLYIRDESLKEVKVVKRLGTFEMSINRGIVRMIREDNI